MGHRGHVRCRERSLPTLGYIDRLHVLFSTRSSFERPRRIGRSIPGVTFSPMFV